MKVALVTDSTCNLSLDMAAERHIYMAPLYVIWGERSFRDGIDFTEDEFYRRLAAAKGDAIPKTSQVSPQDFIDLFRRAREIEQADEVVCAVLSSGLSGTYASAMQAKEAVDFPVHVVDTRQTSWALGHAMLSGADARDKGSGAADIVRTIEAAANRQKLYFTIESLDYLHRGGRIGNARLLLGSALHVQPVLELKEGIVSSVDNVRTRKRAVVHLIKVAEAAAAGKPALRLSVIHANAEDEARELLEKASSKIKPKETHLSYATLVIGVHTGPGALGIIVERDMQA